MLTDLPPTRRPIPHVLSRFRVGCSAMVHRGDMDTGRGLTTLCGKYALNGRYTLTDDPVTCRMCLRVMDRMERSTGQQERLGPV